MRRHTALPSPDAPSDGPGAAGTRGAAVTDGLVRQLLELAVASTFDFRTLACADDPDAHLFDERVARYRRTWALARVLEPRSILDLGPGYGYAAAALLAARPRVAYLGITLDDEDADRAAWVGALLGGYDAAVRRGPVPPATYDLVRVGGPADADVVFHALETAMAHGRHVVVDDYQERSRFLGANELMYQRRDELEACWVLPGHGGHLLLAVAREAVVAKAGVEPASGSPTSDALRHLYDEHYFLEDCGGHDGYKRTNGRRLRDPRLAAVASIGGLGRPRRVLDLGCGRGELAFHFARQGARVTGIDYSAQAVELAERCFVDAPELRPQVELLVGDVCSDPFQGPFDLAVASDLVEHLTPGELEVLYARVAGQLSPGGVFVVHTYPNRWFYEREYPRRRARASALGAYLPPEPRTRYERLMHINEQSPEDLRLQLGRHFRSVVVWAGEPADLGRTLSSATASDDLEVAPGLFALASNAPVDGDGVHRAMAMTRLSAEDVAGVELRVTACPQRVRAGRIFEAGVALANRGRRALRSNTPYPFHLSYRWLTTDGRPLVLDGRRSLIFPWLPPDASDEYDVTVVAPDVPGRHVLRVTAVQELVAWFDDPRGSLAEDVVVSVDKPDGRETP